MQYGSDVHFNCQLDFSCAKDRQYEFIYELYDSGGKLVRGYYDHYPATLNGRRTPTSISETGPLVQGIATHTIDLGERTRQEISYPSRRGRGLMFPLLLLARTL